MRRKRLNRDGWGFQYFPYYQMRIDCEDFHGLASLIRLIGGGIQCWQTPKAGKIGVTGEGMTWLQLVPDGTHRMTTVMYLPDGEYDMTGAGAKTCDAADHAQSGAGRQEADGAQIAADGTAADRAQSGEGRQEADGAQIAADGTAADHAQSGAGRQEADGAQIAADGTAADRAQSGAGRQEAYGAQATVDTAEANNGAIAHVGMLDKFGERKNYPAWAMGKYRPSIWYVDMTDGIDYDGDGVAAYIDKYLDIIFTPEGDIKVDDRDELDAAFEAGEISEEQYKDALDEGDRVLSELCGNIEQTAARCARIRAIVEERIAAGEGRLTYGKEEVALLEFDGGKNAVLNPTHENYALELPERCVFGFLSDCIDEYAAERGLEPVGYFFTITKDFPVYVDTVGGQKVTICQAPLGAPAAVQFMDWLIGYGVRRIVAAGSCGVLEQIPENEFLIPVNALRDEGTSFHYLPAGRFVDTSAKVREVIEQVFTEKGLPFREITTWTTDAFYRETPVKVSARLREGCSCVDMECAAMAACAKFRDVEFGQIFFTADSLANVSCYDARDWGVKSMRPALELGLEVASRL